jgi:hypothetical protein
MPLGATLSALLALASLAAGCSGADPKGSGANGPGDTSTTTKTSSNTPPEEEEPWEHPSVPADSESGMAPGDLAGGPLPPPSRAVRRMRIDTLQAAMTKVAGNDVYGAPIEWKYNGKNGFSDAAFGKALGRPDFQASTEESGVSSALYLKFVGDAARDICSQMAKNDQLRADASTRVLFPKAPVATAASDDQITANLQYLVLRFLGLRVAANDPMITGLRAVYDAGVETAVPGAQIVPAAEGWRGVCVALFESPLFHND